MRVNRGGVCAVSMCCGSTGFRSKASSVPVSSWWLVLNAVCRKRGQAGPYCCFPSHSIHRESSVGKPSAHRSWAVATLNVSARLSRGPAPHHRMNARRAEKLAAGNSSWQAFRFSTSTTTGIRESVQNCTAFHYAVVHHGCDPRWALRRWSKG